MNWIKVSDRLPEKNFTKVLVIDMSLGHESIEVAEWTECGWRSCYFGYIEPSHWCYLNDIELPNAQNHQQEQDRNAMD